MSAAPEARIIWLSDLHFDPDDLVLGHDPRVRLDAAVGFANAHYAGADLCVISGDMVETATAEAYRALRERLNRLAMPWVPLTGNHDGRALFLEHLPLPEARMEGFAQYVVDLDAVRLICLDTLSEGEDAGWLCEARLDWLSAQLETRRDVPALLFMHHPPVDLGLPMLDPDKLRNGAALLKRLEGHRHVAHLCCGHVHQPITGRVKGVGFTTLRAVLYQAPQPVPAWDWDSFSPAQEAPELGAIHVSGAQVTIQTVPFCDYGVGTRTVGV